MTEQPTRTPTFWDPFATIFSLAGALLITGLWPQAGLTHWETVATGELAMFAGQRYGGYLTELHHTLVAPIYATALGTYLIAIYGIIALLS